MFEASTPHAQADEVIRRLDVAIEKAEPLSLVRCGDGEAIVLGSHELIHPTRYMAWMRNFFGDHATDKGIFDRLRAELASAISNSDIVGTFRERVKDVEQARKVMSEVGSRDRLTNEDKRELADWEWRVLNNLIEPLVSSATVITGTSIHIRLEETGFLKRLLERQRRVNLITGNDLKDILERQFRFTRFEVQLVPTEYKFKQDREGWEKTEPHWPNVFDGIVERIRAGEFPGVTLVGAGPCGKIYCSEIKKAGGIAIDVGSILDLWAGRGTRSYMKSATPVTFAT